MGKIAIQKRTRTLISFNFNLAKLGCKELDYGSSIFLSE